MLYLVNSSLFVLKGQTFKEHKLTEIRRAFGLTYKLLTRRIVAQKESLKLHAVVTSPLSHNQNFPLEISEVRPPSN